MSKLQNFIDGHFFSRKARVLYFFFKEHKLIHILELIVNQVQQSSLPELYVTAKGLYIPIKSALKSIEDQDNYFEMDELVREFTFRLMVEYFKRSQYSADEFIIVLKNGLVDGASDIGIDPHALEVDMEWDRIRLGLENLKSPSLSPSIVPPRIDDISNAAHLIWNDQADLDYLKKVLVQEYKVFDNSESIDALFSKELQKVVCNHVHIYFLVFLFRKLCPLRANPEMIDGRIVSTNPKRKLWPILASRLIKFDRTKWKFGTLKNFCSEVIKRPEYRDTRIEVQTIVSRLERKMGVDSDDSIVT